MSNNNDFLTKVVQYAGTIFTIGGLIMQYLFRDEFQKILIINGSNSYYSAFTIAGLILGVTIVICLFANRYILLNRWYPDQEKYKKYLNSIRKRQVESAQNQTPSSELEMEPFYLNGKRFAFILFLLSIVFFIIIFYFPNPLVKSVFYLIFLLSVIFSATTFLLLLYGEEDWKRREEETRRLIDEKIKDFFAPKFKVLERVEDTSNLLYPVTRVLISVENKKYIVATDKNNPNKYFSVQEYIEKKNESKKFAN